MISLVIPVYNYGERLEKSLKELRNWLEGRADVKEIIFVNDGSIDATGRILAGVSAPMRVITLPTNQGKGAAVRDGALSAQGEYIFFTDIDLPFDMSIIDLAMEKFAAGADVVCGSRNVVGSVSTVERRRERQLSSILFSYLANFILISPIADTQCGFKGFTHTAVQKIFSSIRHTGYVFDVEILHTAQQENMRIDFVPVTLINEANSSINLLRDGSKMVFDLLRLYVRTRIHITRHEVLSIAGLGLSIAILSVPTLHNIGAFEVFSRFGVSTFDAVLVLCILFPLFLVVGAIGLLLVPLHKHTAAQFSRYGIIGAFNTTLNAAMFNSFIYLTGISQGLVVTGFAFITFFFITIVAFLGNMLWTFGNQNAQDRKKLYVRFLAVTSTTALVNLVIIHVLVNSIGAPAGIPTPLWANIALFLTIITSVLGNFLGYKFFVFTQTK